MSRYKLSIRRAFNQDAEVILLVRYNDDGTSEYVRDFVWEHFKEFDLLDITGVTVPGACLCQPGNLSPERLSTDAR